VEFDGGTYRTLLVCCAVILHNRKRLSSRFRILKPHDAWLFPDAITPLFHRPLRNPLASSQSSPDTQAPFHS
jgi:hypothetical protein